jgi:hypothetical protein
MDKRLMNASRLEILSRPAPCDDCKHNTKCALDLKACRVFQHYVSTGSFLSSKQRIPSRLVFNEIFYEDEPDFVNLSEERKRLRKQFRSEML